MLNIIIALRLWSSQWRHMHIMTKDPFLALCIRNIWLLIAHNDIDLLVRHIPGVNNTIADTLSRIYSPKSVNKVLQDLMDNYQWEMVPH